MSHFKEIYGFELNIYTGRMLQAFLLGSWQSSDTLDFQGAIYFISNA